MICEIIYTYTHICVIYKSVCLINSCCYYKLMTFSHTISKTESPLKEETRGKMCMYNIESNILIFNQIFNCMYYEILHII